MGSRARLAIVAAVVVAGGAAGLVLSGSSEPKPSVPLPARCQELPQAIEAPRWMPKDLPMPEGSFPTLEVESAAGVRRVLMVANASLDGFVEFVLREWPLAGWKLGVGEREPGEAEDTFLKSNERFGKFRARSVYCDQTKTEVFLELVLEGRDLPTATTT